MCCMASYTPWNPCNTTPQRRIVDWAFLKHISYNIENQVCLAHKVRISKRKRQMSLALLDSFFIKCTVVRTVLCVQMGGVIQQVEGLAVSNNHRDLKKSISLDLKNPSFYFKNKILYNNHEHIHTKIPQNSSK